MRPRTIPPDLQVIDVFIEQPTIKHTWLQKFFRRKPPKDLLPTKPVDTVTVDPWWVVNIGYITEDDIKVF